MKFGGNLVTNLGSSIQKTHQFCDDLYSYAVVIVNNNEVYSLSHLRSARVFLLEGAVTVNGLQLSRPQDSFQLENVEAVITGAAAQSKVLVVGSKTSLDTGERLSLIPAADLKKVDKPWGFEIWITGEHPQYCLKKIFIKEGTKTSLQYHNEKRETNVLFEGAARLHFKKNEGVEIKAVRSEDIGSCDLKNISVIDVFPLTIHRLEALTDILLYEASTPQLDDVVRITDDTNRGHGRIHSEHEKK